MLREGEVIGIMTEWDMTAIQKIFRLTVICSMGRKNIFRFHHCEKYMDGYHIGHFEMGYQDGEKIWNGNSGHAPVDVMHL